jgi:large subunit ribosomal protein L22
MKATLKNHHQTPRKVRLVADAIRGKSVPLAKHTLMFLNKKAAEPMEKLLDSAVANARINNLSAEDLVVKTVTVDKGTVMKRYRPFARGRAGTLRKIMSHVSIELAAVTEPAKKKAPAKKTVETDEEKPVKKTAKKPAKKAAK